MAALPPPAGGGGGDGVLAIPRHQRKAARKSRSFRRRQAPITRGQRRTLRELWPKHGLGMDFHKRWDFGAIFSTKPGATVTLDIGFGSGESLIEMAAARPGEYFVGIEVHKPGVAAALARLESEGLTNVKIAQGDAITALTDHIEDGSLSACCIFFPDPFPQDRDAGRRLVRPLLLSLLSSKLRAGGALHVATDVQAYAEHTVRVMDTAVKPLKKVLQPSMSSLPPRSPRATAEAAQREGQEDALAFFDERSLQRGYHVAPEVGARGVSGWPQEEEQKDQGEDGRDTDAATASGKVSALWEGGEAEERPSWRPFTKYEEKAEDAGRRVRDFSYRLQSRAGLHPP